MHPVPVNLHNGVPAGGNVLQQLMLGTNTPQLSVQVYVLHQSADSQVFTCEIKLEIGRREILQRKGSLEKMVVMMKMMMKMMS